MLPVQLRRGNGNLLEPIDMLGQEFNRMLNRWVGGEAQASTAFYPVDIREDEDHIYIDAEMPGFRKEEVSITLENGVLSIEAQRKVEEKQGGKPSESHLLERRFTRIARSFTLPTSVDENKVDAKLQDGVLRLTLNKREEVKPRKIEVK